ncbi:Uncharacterized protein FWK35_00029932 [Aphis craccivora]|uniref:Uncharacterized protein n=1 Tax=Aphis craccivora TaxID=307492 RepID=A0A6G0VPV2_APHCR|nr:Uncharacterized protein FWK35_00029932 [Aphis craccivora]
MKLFPCWSNIILNVFGYGENIATSSRSESNFNNIKTRVFNHENMPVRELMTLLVNWSTTIEEIN